MTPAQNTRVHWLARTAGSAGDVVEVAQTEAEAQEYRAAGWTVDGPFVLHAEGVALAVDEVRTVLAWCNAADFEAKVDEDELPLVDKLAAAAGDDPSDYATVRRSL